MSGLDVHFITVRNKQKGAKMLEITISPSVSDLTLFTVLMSLVTNIVNTDYIIAVIFPRWRGKTEAAM